jgi:hypothetical protein
MPGGKRDQRVGAALIFAAAIAAAHRGGQLIEAFIERGPVGQ